ncbi:mycofactocin biosynthesis peptidyl-dipeptidase MftE [Frankia sp. Cas4]|uniref:mycofactocin biosynthesis peptidyl-dipeptidase MftE n=1 Tax=Frankia sp. Cas4 TaxID=3073927 RepID=UPI002AD390C3|nr:mycofactocin biosynthesis peptidyl-dipeptidase MftE [Frankia sp. Cas4]
MNRLGERCWPELRDQSPLVAVPLGSTEQHGPHLPLDTDTRIARALADGLASRLPGVLAAPALAYGASGEHADFPGTLSLGNRVLALAAVEIARSADITASGVVFVNGHGGNAPALREAVTLLRSEGRHVLAWAPRSARATDLGIPAGDTDLHAGRIETSLMLHLAPDLVRLDRAVAGPSPPLAELIRRGVGSLSPSGVLGDPTGASPGEGALLLRAYVDDLVTAVARWDESRRDESRRDESRWDENRPQENL